VILTVAFLALIIGIGAAFSFFSETSKVTKTTVTADPTLHADADDLASLVWTQMSLPCTPVVRSRLAQLTHSKHCELMLKPLLSETDMNYRAMIQRIEKKFLAIDMKIAKLLHERKTFSEQAQLEQYSSTHEQKYRSLIEKIDSLLSCHGQRQFIESFLALNETLNTYINQLNSFTEEQRKVRSPEAYSRYMEAMG
jgi:hypothetical protein